MVALMDPFEIDLPGELIRPGEDDGTPLAWEALEVADARSASRRERARRLASAAGAASGFPVMADGVMALNWSHR